MPGARCTRGLVCKVHIESGTRAYRFSGGNPAFPAQWLYGLCRALPVDEFVFVTVAAGLTEAETAPFVLRVANRSRINDPPCDCPFAPTLPRPPHPLPRFVTIMIRPSCREKTGKLVDLICPTA